MSKLETSRILDKFILNELRHSLCNYANNPDSVLYKGTIITVRHAINTFYEGQFNDEGFCDISVNKPEHIAGREWSRLKLLLFIFIDKKLEVL